MYPSDIIVQFLTDVIDLSSPHFSFCPSAESKDKTLKSWRAKWQHRQLCLSFNPWLIVISTCFHQALFITCLKRFLLNPFTSRLLILSQFYQLVQIQVHLFTFFGSIYCMFLKCFLSSIPTLIKVIRDSHKKKINLLPILCYVDLGFFFFKS